MADGTRAEAERGQPMMNIGSICTSCTSLRVIPRLFKFSSLAKESLRKPVQLVQLVRIHSNG